MFRSSMSLTFVLFVFFFALTASTSDAQQVSGVTGYTYNTTSSTGQPMIGFHVEWNDVYFLDDYAVTTYFRCGEDSPTPGDPGTYVGGGWTQYGPATAPGALDLADGRKWPPFQGCTQGWYSIEIYVDGISYWYFFPWSEDES